MVKENLIVGKKYEIHGYKHDGKIHRAWDEAVLLEIHDDYLIFGNEKTKVTESDGRSWRTKEPAILYFFHKNTLDKSKVLIFILLIRKRLLQ
jgi:protein associated with RNAse G/E